MVSPRVLAQVRVKLPGLAVIGAAVREGADEPPGKRGARRGQAELSPAAMNASAMVRDDTDSATTAGGSRALAPPRPGPGALPCAETRAGNRRARPTAPG